MGAGEGLQDHREADRPGPEHRQAARNRPGSGDVEMALDDALLAAVVGQLQPGGSIRVGELRALCRENKADIEKSSGRRFDVGAIYAHGRRGVAQPGSAPASGAGSRWFESIHPDHASDARQPLCWRVLSCWSHDPAARGYGAPSAVR